MLALGHRRAHRGRHHGPDALAAHPDRDPRRLRHPALLRAGLRDLSRRPSRRHAGPCSAHAARRPCHHRGMSQQFARMPDRRRRRRPRRSAAWAACRGHDCSATCARTSARSPSRSSACSSRRSSDLPSRSSSPGSRARSSPAAMPPASTGSSSLLIVLFCVQVVGELRPDVAARRRRGAGRRAAARRAVRAPRDALARLPRPAHRVGRARVAPLERRDARPDDADPDRHDACSRRSSGSSAR